MSQAGRYFSNSAAPGTTLFLEGNSGGQVGPDGTGTIFVVGAGDINTTGNPLTNTITVTLVGTTDHAVQIGNAAGDLSSIAVGTNGQVLIGATGADPAFASLTSTGGTITFTPGVNTLNLDVTGGTAIHTINGNSGFAAGSTITLTTGLNNIQGTARVTGNNATTLTITFSDGNTNTGLGREVFSNVGFSGGDNTALGYRAGFSTTSASENTLVGTFAGISLTTGGTNTLIGYFVGVSLSTGANNTLIGSQSGSNYNGIETGNILINNPGITGESNTLRIGQAPASGQQQITTSYIYGIYGVTPGVGGPLPVVIDSNGQLGTASSIGINTYTDVNTSPYVVVATDQYLGIDCSIIPITIQLPDAPAVGRSWTLKDRTGSSFTNNITVTTVGGAVLIDGAPSLLMNTNYSSINVLFDGTAYQVY
jgi:hypothetical protein